MQYLILGALFATIAAQAQNKPDSGSIEGHVFNTLTSAPVRKATVTLDAVARGIHLVAETDSEGKFEFTGLPGGGYRLTASRAGFLERRALNRVVLGPEQHLTNSNISIPPQGVISGRILDVDGDPLAGARLSIFKQVFSAGRKSLLQINVGALTNDAGEYRIANLPKGRYILQGRNAKPEANNRLGDSNTSRLAYVPTYYPNAPTPEKGVAVELAVGMELAGIDIQLARFPRPTAVHIRGKVAGVEANPQIIISVGLIAVDSLWPSGASTSTRHPDHGFDLLAIPGQYTMMAKVYSGGAEAYATTTLNVSGDTDNVVLTMSPAPQISGKIRIAESGARIKIENLALTLRLLSLDFARFDCRVNAEGNFAFAKPIRPGRYVLEATVPDGYFVQKLLYGAEEVSADDFDIQSSAKLEIVLSNTAGKLRATAHDGDGKPMPDSVLTLIPIDDKSHPQKRIAGEDGSVEFKSLRPGKYKLFAWDRVDEEVWQDPDFLKNYASQAIEVTVGPGETKTSNLVLIRTE